MSGAKVDVTKRAFENGEKKSIVDYYTAHQKVVSKTGVAEKLGVPVGIRK